MVNSLDEFAKMIFEDEELFNGLCDVVKAGMELVDARDKAGEKALRNIYRSRSE